MQAVNGASLPQAKVQANHNHLTKEITNRGMLSIDSDASVDIGITKILYAILDNMRHFRALILLHVKMSFFWKNRQTYAFY